MILNQQKEIDSLDQFNHFKITCIYENKKSIEHYSNSMNIKIENELGLFIFFGIKGRNLVGK